MLTAADKWLLEKSAARTDWLIASHAIAITVWLIETTVSAGLGRGINIEKSPPGAGNIS